MTIEKALGKPFKGPEYAAMEDDIAGMVAVRRIRHLSQALIEAADEATELCGLNDIELMMDGLEKLKSALRISAGVSK